MRLIDADDLIAHTFKNDISYKAFVNLVKKQQTIEERKTGKWIWDDEGYHCSECFFHAYGDTLSCLDGTFKFCPHCGAKMGEVKEDE